MKTNHVARAEEYYNLVGEKNIEGVKKYLHPDVEFNSPMATLKGKEAVVQATTNYMKIFNSLTIRAKFGAQEQAMIVYDVDIPGIRKDFPGAVLLTFCDVQIIKVELFFDSAAFQEKKEEIFS